MYTFISHMYAYIYIYIAVYIRMYVGHVLQVEALEREVDIGQEPYASRILTSKQELEREHGLVWP